jgi:hypothetical protein
MSATSISFGLLIVLVTILLLRWMPQTQTAISWVSITKDVPVLRIDHVLIKGALLGVRRSLFSKAVSVTVEQ